MIRRVAAATLFAAIVVIGIEPTLLSFPFIDRAPVAKAYTGIFDRRYPGYPEFLDAVRAHTQNGDTIAILVPPRKWEFGYSYAYFRASYLLAGREVLPLVSDKDVLLGANFAAAKYIAAWRVAPPDGEVVMRASGGVLVKRR